MSYTASSTYTFSVVDIENVMRRFSADIVMIAQSSQATTEATARDYAHDAELLAKYGYLRMVDVTLLDGSREVRAAQYVVNTNAGDLTASRPGGVLWPRVSSPFLRIILYYTASYDSNAREALRPSLRIPWITTNADTSHVGLAQSGSRDYASNGWGMQRRDFSA